MTKISLKKSAALGLTLLKQLFVFFQVPNLRAETPKKLTHHHDEDDSDLDDDSSNSSLCEPLTVW